MNDTEGSNQQTDWLVLIPTSFEATKIQNCFELPKVQMEVCGFGPIVSAAKTVELLYKHRPQNVVLVGIAGSYDQALKTGNAYRFSNVVCDGVGAGEGSTFQSAEAMGWSQGADKDGNTIGDRLSLGWNSETDGRESDGRELLTVCAASDGNEMAEARRKRFPKAKAEDMEGFAVAAACQIFGVELTIVRGISNLAGDRHKSNWKIDDALSSASKLAAEIIGTKN